MAYFVQKKSGNLSQNFLRVKHINMCLNKNGSILSIRE